MAESLTQSCGPFSVLACQSGSYLKRRMLYNILCSSIRYRIMWGKILPADNQLPSLMFLQDILRLKSTFRRLVADNYFGTLFVKYQNIMVERLFLILGSGVAEESPVTFVCIMLVKWAT